MKRQKQHATARKVKARHTCSRCGKKRYEDKMQLDYAINQTRGFWVCKKSCT